MTRITGSATREPLYADDSDRDAGRNIGLANCRVQRAPQSENGYSSPRAARLDKIVLKLLFILNRRNCMVMRTDMSLS